MAGYDGHLIQPDAVASWFHGRSACDLDGRIDNSHFIVESVPNFTDLLQKGCSFWRARIDIHGKPLAYLQGEWNSDSDLRIPASFQFACGNFSIVLLEFGGI